MSISIPAATGTTQELASYVLNNEKVQLGTISFLDSSTPIPVTTTNRMPIVLPSDQLSTIATATNQVTELDRLGTLTETAPGTDTASSGINGRLQRIAQRLTSLIALIPAQVSGRLPVDGSGVTQPVSATSLPLPGGAATETSLATVVTSLATELDRLGTLTETAPGTDTASSGLNGRLQRIAQRLTSLIALIPAQVSGRLPVDGSGVTQPVSATSLPLPGGAATETSAAASATSLGVIDDWDETDRCKVNPIAGQAGVAGGSGTVGATTQRVVLATDVALPAGSNSIGTVVAGNAFGDVAHDGADSGNPIKIGGKATTALHGLTLVSDADRTNIVAGIDGVPIVRLNSNLESLVSGNASNTDGSSTQVIAASGAGVKTYLTDVTLSNTSASNIYVEIKDGTTVKWTFPVPANGGVTHRFESPIAGTANTAWNFDPSAAATTIYCSAAGFKSKI